jgi:AcrR family transcriptional regulator
VRERPKGTVRERPKGTVRERQREATRQALLDAAADAFAELSYADVTIDDITMRAGTARGTFYLYFSKGKILAELVDNAFFGALGEPSSSLLSDDLRSAAPYTVDSLATWIGRYVATWQRNLPLARAWMDGEGTDPEVRGITERRVNRAVGMLSSILAEEQTRAGRVVDWPLLRARALVMDLQMQYFCVHAVVRGFEVDLDAGITAIAEQWWETIHRGGEPAGTPGR